MKKIKNTVQSKMVALGASTFVLMVMPLVSHAKGISELITNVGSLLGRIVPIMMTLAVIAFFWGLIKYLFGEGGEGKGEGLKIMGYGILVIFVMVSLGGLVAFLQDSTGVNKSRTITPPCIGTNCNQR